MKRTTEQIIDKSRLIAQSIAERFETDNERRDAERYKLAWSFREYRRRVGRKFNRLFAIKGHYLAELPLEKIF